MDMSQEKMEQLGKIAFVNKIAEMLLSTEAVSRDNDFQTVCYHVARVLDEAEEHGIKTERLMGMYVLLRLGDQVNPYDVPKYAAVLDDPSLTEADKAHLLQMIRIGEL